MGWTFNKIPLRGILSGIMESIGDIRNINGDMVGGSNGNNQMECRCRQDWRRGMVKVNTFYLGSTISEMVQAILVYFVTYIIDDWVHNGLQYVGCAW